MVLANGLGETTASNFDQSSPPWYIAAGQAFKVCCPFSGFLCRRQKLQKAPNPSRALHYKALFYQRSPSTGHLSQLKRKIIPKALLQTSCSACFSSYLDFFFFVYFLKLSQHCYILEESIIQSYRNL